MSQNSISTVEGRLPFHCCVPSGAAHVQGLVSLRGKLLIRSLIWDYSEGPFYFQSSLYNRLRQVCCNSTFLNFCFPHLLSVCYFFPLREKPNNCRQIICFLENKEPKTPGIRWSGALMYFRLGF